MTESEDNLLVLIEEKIEGLDEELNIEENNSSLSLKEYILSKRFFYNILGISVSILFMIIVIKVSFGSIHVIEIARNNPWQYKFYIIFFFSGVIIGLFSIRLKDSIIITIGLIFLTLAITLPLLIRELVENTYPMADTVYFTMIFILLALILIGVFLAYEVKDYIKWIFERRKIINSL